MALGPTPSQTVGPFFHFGLEPSTRLVDEGDPDAIRIRGVVRDGNGDPVTDALVETWQANRHGRYAHPDDDREGIPKEDGFDGFGRAATDADGAFEILTVKPGRVPGPGGRQQAPHIGVSVFARGLLNRVVTRIYFPDEAEANADDAVLNGVAEDAHRSTLIARDAGDGALTFDIHLQGDRQTAFFDI
jgi:protocatechuate 3,4-dioxygenase alpha subunit